MASLLRKPSFFSRRIAFLGVVIAGVIGCVLSYYFGRQDEIERARVQFIRRADIRHTLSQEILTHHEAALFTLHTMFALDGNVTRTEFIRATHELAERNPGIRAFEWVPAVTAENRAAVEASISRRYPSRNFEFVERDAIGQMVRAGDRPEYYPISYIEPMKGNEFALGYDLKTSPTLSDLEHARQIRQWIVTGQIHLLQEKTAQLGVIMIWPVYRAAPKPKPGEAAGPDLFLGFVQSVFSVHEMLEITRAQHPDAILDMLFLDASETSDPAKRVLYYRPADDLAPRSPAPTEEEFRRGLVREQHIPMGGRDWTVLYRPRAGWLEEQYTFTPLLRSCGFLVLTGLLAGLVHTLARRNEVIEREVNERTLELSESRRQLSSLMHSLPGMAYRCCPGKRLNVLYASEGSVALTGHVAEDFTSQRVHFRDFIHPDDLERVREATQAGLKERREFEIEYRVRSRDGIEKWVLSRGRGVYARDGTLQVFEGLAIDITAQKNAENDRIAIERKLLEGQKLESLGLLAGGIAHDFNNLLTGILGNASLARLTLPRGGPCDPQLRAIETASLRAAELCRQMLAYAGKGRFVVEPVDLSSLVEDMLPLLKISIGRGVRVQLALGRDLPAVMADATQLRQIVMNLVINASDAISDQSGEVFLTTGVMNANAAVLKAAVAGTELPAGSYVFLEVRDTGCGMMPETIRKIFDPFFSTKFAGRGLGLAAVLGIVRGHHGALNVESAPSRGSTFRLLLPPFTTEPAVPTLNATATPWRHAARVLIIEDDEVVRTVTTETLKSYGLSSDTAPNGDAGLTAFRENPTGYDLVLLDLIMPGLSGEQTLAGLRAIRSNVAVVMMSGYSENDALTRLADPKSPLEFLHKPFTREMLERKLRAIFT